MTQSVETSVRSSITVPVSQERAFEVFTANFGAWWPKEYSIGASDMADFIVEPKTGGRWYEIGVDGAECDTGRVIAFDPPDRLVLAWHLDGQWHYDPDPARASEVEVRFIAEDPTRTRVDLEHRGFERHGDHAQAVREGVSRGWPFLLELYAKHAAT